MLRRDFLRTSAALAAAPMAVGGALAAPRRSRAQGSLEIPPDLDWESVRGLFDMLDPDTAHFSGFFLVSHPRPVREAMARYRIGLDRNPIDFLERHGMRDGDGLDDATRAALARWLGVDEPGLIALTDSTTMGLGLIYNNFRLREGQEVLTTTHDHYSTRQSLEFRAARDGAKVVRIPLYQDPATTSVDEIVGSLQKGVSDRTRLVAVTWVHSCSGVTLPVRAIADMLAQANRRRDAADRIFLCVDGVHGLGVENETIPELGCDIFIAGTHKWMFGPRGTGLVWASEAAWEQVAPIIPPFNAPLPPGLLHTPGGFHSFEHRWALKDAVEFREALGRERVHARIHELNRRIKEGLAPMKHVVVHTPMADELSAGIVCFDVRGAEPEIVVQRLVAQKIYASESPYDPSCARLAGSLLVNEQHVDRALEAVSRLG